MSLHNSLMTFFMLFTETRLTHNGQVYAHFHISPSKVLDIGMKIKRCRVNFISGRTIQIINSCTLRDAKLISIKFIKVPLHQEIEYLNIFHSFAEFFMCMKIGRREVC